MVAELDMKTPFKEDLTNLNYFFKSHRNFSLRAVQELKRAERYSEFVSLILIDLEKWLGPLSKREKESFRSGNLEKDLYDLVTRETRQTDLVSGIEHNKMALLLTETSPEGAKILAQRLTQEIALFLAAERKKLLAPKALMKIVSFPDKQKGKEKFLSVVKALQVDK